MEENIILEKLEAIGQSVKMLQAKLEEDDQRYIEKLKADMRKAAEERDKAKEAMAKAKEALLNERKKMEIAILALEAGVYDAQAFLAVVDAHMPDRFESAAAKREFIETQREAYPFLFAPMQETTATKEEEQESPLVAAGQWKKGFSLKDLAALGYQSN